MALTKINNNFEDTIQEFINDALFLKGYNKPGTLSRPDYDKKVSTEVFNHFMKNLKNILSSEEGREQLKTLLLHENDYIRFLAARYLYPTMCDKCMNIMQTYRNGLVDRIEIFEADTVINGILDKQKVFIDQFKKLYNCDDLESLNRE